MPAPQTVTEPLFNAIAPEGVSFHTARLQMGKGSSVERLSFMEASVPQAVAELAQARVHCIDYLCVGSGLLRGAEHEKQFCDDVERNTGIPVISALLSVAEAMDTVGIKKLVATDPYGEVTEDMEKKFLQSRGFQVLGIHGLGIDDPFEFGQVRSQDIYAFCRRVWDPAAEGLYIGCCAFNAMPVIERLEKELNVPVVTAHSAVLWKTLKTLGIKEPLRGFGKLLSEHL